MKTILTVLKAGINFDVGFHQIIAYSDGKTIAVRLGSSLLSPTYPLNMAGLRAALKWMDQEGLGNALKT
jgi:hypothetical protein